MSPRRLSLCSRLALGALVLACAPRLAAGFDRSLPASLQYFEGTYQTQFERAADLFMAGYGAVWVPPTGRASSGNLSVGYDPRDRFDLGTWDNKTLHGSETGLRAFADRFERAGGAVLVDLIWNHNGFQYDSTPGFVAAGAYPGMVVQNPDGGADPFGVPGTHGDFHSPSAGGFDSRFGGLIDIDHASDHRLIRNPVDPADPRNVPAGAGSWFGETFNVPRATNARFYPDRGLAPILVSNPATGQSGVAIYPFNADEPLAGDPVPENALGYLMRNAQWLVQDVGVDGFRLDIPWHYPEWVLGYFDQAVYRASPRRNLDGSQYHVFSYMEAGDGPQSELIRRFVRKTINPADPGRVGSNYDALDFNFLRAVHNNLTSNGLQNDWRNVVVSHLDHHDDGLTNGSAGIKFVQSHDDTPAALNNVAHAYMLMLPGQANVYFNAKQHGDGRDFPRNGRGDALGGVYGDRLTSLLDIRDSHGRGDYRQRLLEKETYVFERGNAALVGLSNRGDGGFTERRVNVDFAVGATLVELTGASARSADVPDLVTVGSDTPGGVGRATIRVPHNGSGDNGYVIYGLAPPRSAEGIVVSQDGAPVPVVPGGTPLFSDFSNGAVRLADRRVVTGDTFTLEIQTQPVTLTGRRLENGQLVPRSVRDRDADGSDALFRVNGGLDLNGQNPFGTLSGVDFDSGDLGGFERFVTIRQPGYDAADGVGRYAQTIDTTLLPEGENYVTVRALRRRNDGGPDVWADFREVLYVDRLDPVSAIDDLRQVNVAGAGDHDLIVESIDLTADRVHVFVNLPATLPDADVLALAEAGQGRADRVDVNRFKRFEAGLIEGNNVLTVVTLEVTGNSSVRRHAGQVIASGRGRGLGDLNADGVVNAADLTGPAGFELLLYGRNAAFNPAADLTADGLVDNRDLLLLPEVVLDAATDARIPDRLEEVLLRRADVNADGVTDLADLIALEDGLGGSEWLLDVDGNGVVEAFDARVLVTELALTSPGDFNLDGVVDASDYTVWRDNQGAGLVGDANFDALVNAADLAIWQDSYGEARRQLALTSVSVAVPEPAAALLGVGLAAPWARARRDRS